MKKNNIFDFSFAFLFIYFWIIVWYKWIAVTTNEFNMITTLSFFILSLIFIFFNICIEYNKQDSNKNIILIYRVIVLLTFIASLFSFVLLPSSLSIFYIKNLLAIVCIYISSKRLLVYKDEDALVGILASTLLIVLDVLY